MTAALAISVSGAFAQGTITFNNGTANVINWAVPGKTGAVPATDGIKVGLYYQGASGFTLVSPTPYLGTLSSGATNTAVNGRWNVGTVTVAGLTAGQTGTFQVRAWSGGFASYEAAVAGGALYGSGPGAIGAGSVACAPKEKRIGDVGWWIYPTSRCVRQQGWRV